MLSVSRSEVCPERDGHAMHCWTLVALRVVLYFPIAQSSHTPPPIAALYLPAAHATHFVLSKLNPLLHSQISGFAPS